MYLKIFQLQSLVNLGFIGFLFPVRCTPQKGFSRNLWAGIQIWVNQGGRSNVSVLPYCMTVIKIKSPKVIGNFAVEITKLFLFDLK